MPGERPPAAELDVEAPAFFAPILPEMEAEIWQAGIQALVTVPEQSRAPATSPDDWIDEARLFQSESTSAETPVLAAGLLMAAARAAEVAGQAAEAASGYDELWPAHRRRRTSYARASAWRRASATSTRFCVVGAVGHVGGDGRGARVLRCALRGVAAPSPSGRAACGGRST